MQGVNGSSPLGSIGNFSVVYMKKILIICPFPLNTVPGQRLKYEQYLNYLSQNGYSIEVIPFFNQSTYRILYKNSNFLKKVFGTLQGYFCRILDLYKVYKSDGIYIFLNVVPLGPALIEWLYIKLAKKTIYDIDDMVFQLKTASPNKISKYFKSKGRYYFLLKKANHCITCTPELNKIAQKYNKNTTDISSTINTNSYIPVNTYNNKKDLIIGWTGSHSTVPYLRLLDDVLKQLAKKYTFKLLVMGTDSFEINGVNVECINWSVEKEIPTLQRMDIGLYPLPNDEWIKGKSGLKALQYMAMGLPVVASNLGCNDRVIENNISGLLVNSMDEWYKSISQLIQKDNLRRFLGENARLRVEKYFSIEANKNTYLSIFNSNF